ncbi:MAG: hypothetical protein HYU78_10120 [Rhodocyclales bacterium]|nr:hypothetical protein [Rhodocyclales bacterium]
MRLPYRFLPALLLAAPGWPAAAQTAAGTATCHYVYGGETRTLRAAPTDAPYAVPAIKVGSFFRFRVVAEGAPAALKTYVYEDRDSGPVLLHQGVYPWPASEAAGQRYGFSGLQRVYEPLYGSEFEYWCTVRDTGEGTK